MATKDLTTSAGPTRQKHSQEPAAAEPIDTALHVRRLNSVARMALSAVAGRHQCGGELEIDIEALQATMTLLLSMWERINEATDRRSGHRAADLINEGQDMEWFQARGLLVLLDHQAWRMLDDKVLAADPAAIDDVEHALRALCEVLPTPSRFPIELAKAA